MSQHKAIWIATPYGKDGMGGIDRLNDGIMEAFGAHPEFEADCIRLVTRGKRGLWRAQYTFAIALARFCVAAWRKKVDLLHVHLSDRGSGYRKALLGVAARTFNVPYVVHLHGLHLRELWAQPAPILKYLVKRLFLGSSQIIVLGDFWREAVLVGVPGATSRIVVLPNASPAQLSRRAPLGAGRTLQITFLGQLGARKGVPELVEALGRIAHKREWRATIAGDGDIEVTRGQVAREGIVDRVSVPGWLDGPARTDLLANSDILVLPSHAENLPMVIVEAFSHGLAVIATPVGAVPEVITEGYNGMLVPPGDVAALAHAIERMLIDHSLRKSLAMAARDTHLARFEFENYICRLAAIWHYACGPDASVEATSSMK